MNVANLLSVSNYPSAPLQVPRGYVWQNKGNIFSLIVSVAITALALTIAPIAFAIGFAGFVISTTIVPALHRHLVSSHLLSKHNYLTFVFTEVLSGAVFLGSLVAAVQYSPYSAASSAVNAFLGYHVPFQLKGELISLFSSRAGS